MKDVKVCAMSDLHGRLNLLDPKGADVCVIAGDIAPTLKMWFVSMSVVVERQTEWMCGPFFDAIRSYPNTKFVVTPGNHDFWEKSLPPISERPENFILLADKMAAVSGLRIYGSPWVPYINGMWNYEVKDEKTLESAFEGIPDDLDILITHTPPCVEKSLIDRPSVVNLFTGDRVEHLGSKALTSAIKKHHPKYHFCGHIHSGDHTPTIVSTTTCVNVSLIDDSYRSAYEPFVTAIGK